MRGMGCRCNGRQGRCEEAGLKEGSDPSGIWGGTEQVSSDCRDPQAGAGCWHPGSVGERLIPAPLL